MLLTGIFGTALPPSIGAAAPATGTGAQLQVMPLGQALFGGGLFG